MPLLSCLIYLTNYLKVLNLLHGFITYIVYRNFFYSGVGEINHGSYISFSFSKSSKSLKRPTAFLDVRKVFICINLIGRSSSTNTLLKV